MLGLAQQLFATKKAKADVKMLWEYFRFDYL